jgi:hypothetical protein
LLLGEECTNDDTSPLDQHIRTRLPSVDTMPKRKVEEVAKSEVVKTEGTRRSSRTSAPPQRYRPSSSRTGTANVSGDEDDMISSLAYKMASSSEIPFEVRPLLLLFACPLCLPSLLACPACLICLPRLPSAPSRPPLPALSAASL